MDGSLPWIWLLWWPISASRRQRTKGLGCKATGERRRTVGWCTSVLADPCHQLITWAKLSKLNSYLWRPTFTIDKQKAAIKSWYFGVPTELDHFSWFSEHFCGGDELPFLCYNTTFVYGNLELDFCVYGSLVCDGKVDCDNGEDEENCIRMAQEYLYGVIHMWCSHGGWA